MRRLIAASGALLILLFTLLPAPLARAAGGDRINDFTATYAVQADGSVRVSERLVYQFDSSERHGIQRKIVTAQGFKNETDRHRAYQMSAVSASSPSGAPAQVSQIDDGEYTTLRIGDPNRTVSGTQTYEVNYTLAHVVNPQGSTVELNWNVLGLQTSVPTDRARVTVTGPAAISRTTCYQGSYGSKETCTSSPGQEATFSATNLGPNQGMTVVAAFPAKVFTDTSFDLRSGGINVSPAEAAKGTLLPISWGVGIGAPVLAAVVMGLLVFAKGRDRKFADVTPGLTAAPGQSAATTTGGSDVVAVQFQPPAGVTPALMGTVLNEGSRNIDVSATIVDLAVRGFLRMRELPGSGLLSKSDWELTALEPPRDQRLLPYEQTLLQSLFRDGSPVRLSDLRNTFASRLKLVRGQLDGEARARDWFVGDPKTRKGCATGCGVALFVPAFVVGFFGLVGMQAWWLIGIPLGLVLAGIIVILLGRRLPARTPTGAAVRTQSLGFAEYLKTAEQYQLKFEEAERIFSRYMPYAVVLGIATQWAATFERVAQAAAAAGQPISMPVWYIGMTPNFAGIGTGLDGFNTSAATSMSSTPGSSGGSGFSGGFSGGGGGGGGTSSW
ncbi:DUF2207 domain-containing protein [Calidifontibacter sp. DB0510]|uniref:DUF2207 domain-containing protein n=1 Tax=Metallococcus carri TaxID=1656884 RepID=A0A967EG15_9MICO|nr:DUF2207 domain-containing protein [Metallococcus carri]NHN54528.1 DUF2207 domain-containing protein [Metallococcus carri]NOP36633.1 DUF2207 domain-containing protein [Calidifontibacter sp. DB2511S]